MTDKQIFENEIKCIIRRNKCVCNGGSDCIKCDLLMDSEEIVKCYNRAIKNSDLINRQKAEIEILKKQLDVAKMFYKEEAKKRDLYSHMVSNLKKENAKQKAMLEAIDNEMFPLPFETDFDKAIKTVKSEALIDFAERLKSKVNDLEFRTKTHRKTVPTKFCDDNANWVMHECVPQEIDNLVKEMTKGE